MRSPVGIPNIGPPSSLQSGADAAFRTLSLSPVAPFLPSVLAQAMIATGLSAVAQIPLMAGPSGDVTGVTDTANFNEAITAVLAGYPVAMWPGHYYVNSGLVVTPTAPGQRLGGLFGVGGMPNTIIEQVTDNTPIFKLQGAFSWSDLFLWNMLLQWTNQQTVAAPNAWGVIYSPQATGKAIHRLDFRNLGIQQSYAGFGIDPGTGFASGIFNSDFINLWIHDPAHRGVSMAPAAPIGEPELRFSKLFIDAPDVTPDDVAIRLSGGCSIQFDTLGIEDWKNTIFQQSGGAVCQINNLHVERHTITIDGNPAFVVNGSKLAIREATIAGTVNIAGQTIQPALFNDTVGADSAGLSLDDVEITYVLTSGTLALVRGSTAWKYGISLRKVRDINGVLSFPFNAGDAAAISQRLLEFDPSSVGVAVSSNLGANVTSVTPAGNHRFNGALTIVMSGALAANTRIATITYAGTYGTFTPIPELVNQTSGAGLAIVNFYSGAETGVKFDLFADQALAAGTYLVRYRL